jgi:DNA-directed RNA polymerase
MVQKYNKASSKTIAFDKKPTKLQGLEGWERYKKKYTYLNIDKKHIDARKQVLAFKANLIHHLDAVWVHSTLLKLFESENFGGICVVHDCFGVNFDDIEILNKTVRLVLIEFFKNNNAYALLYHLNKIKYNVNYDKNNISYEEKEIEDASLKKLASLGLKNNIDRILQDLDLAYYLIFPG